MRKVKVLRFQYEQLLKEIPVKVNLGNYKVADLTPAYINNGKSMRVDIAWDYIEQEYVELEVID